MNLNDLIIQEATSANFEAVMEVEKQAFGSDEEAGLVADLLDDETAEPIISLLAFHNNEAVGHILFTRVYIENQPNSLAHILAPIAVKPEFQRKGIGGLLIKTGIELLKEMGTELVFVLGHIKYYPKFGFIGNAGSLGFSAPYAIPEEVADAWMLQELKRGAVEQYEGKVTCANMLMKPEYWRE